MQFRNENLLPANFSNFLWHKAETRRISSFAGAIRSISVHIARFIYHDEIFILSLCQPLVKHPARCSVEFGLLFIRNPTSMMEAEKLSNSAINLGNLIDKRMWSDLGHNFDINLNEITSCLSHELRSTGMLFSSFFIYLLITSFVSTLKRLKGLKLPSPDADNERVFFASLP